MNIVNPYRFGVALPLPFKFKVTVANGEVIPLPFDNGFTYNLTVNYGDAGGDKIVTVYNAADASNTYAVAGTYEITIDGLCESFQVNTDANISTNIVEVTQWGSVGFKSLNFYGCTNLNVTATDIPDFSTLTDFTNLFRNCSSLTTVPNMSAWTTTSVTNMTSMLSNADSFSQDITGWDVSNVTVFAAMFINNNSFNQDISGWDVSSCTNFSSMLRNCTSFNRDLGGWDIQAATSMTLFAEGATAWSVANWNATLIGWNALVDPPSNITISVKPIATGAGLTAKNNLVATWGWTINENV